MVKENSVFLTILSTSERDGWLAPGLLGFVMGLGNSGGVQREVHVELMYNVHPVDAARNTIAKNFLNSDCAWLAMVDNDMTPPPNLLRMLDSAAEHMDILVPMFHVTLNVVQRETIRLDVGLGWQPLNVGAERAEWTELSLASSGVMFVRRKAFERMTRPFFRFIYDEDGRVCECEDLFFCRKAREAGSTIWGNSNYYVDHFKTIPLSLPARSSQFDLRGVAGRVPAIAAAPRG